MVLVLLHTENLQNQSIGHGEIDEALFDSKDDSATAFKRFRNIKFEARRHDFDGDDDDDDDDDNDDDEEASSSDVVTCLEENMALALSAAGTFTYDRISFNFGHTRDPITVSQLFWMKYLQCSTLKIKGDIDAEVVKTLWVVMTAADTSPSTIPSQTRDHLRWLSIFKGFT